jgi:hypothetical protein
MSELRPSHTDDLWSDRICELVDAGFATVSRNPSDHETAMAYRHAIATLLDELDGLRAEVERLRV